MVRRVFVVGRGFTLVELLVVVTVMTILIVGMVGVARHVQGEGRIRNTGSTIEVMVTALEEYQRERQHLASGTGGVFPRSPQDFAWEFGLDPCDPVCLGNTLGTLPGDVVDKTGSISTLGQVATIEEEAWVSSKVLYYHLNDDPACRAILNKLPGSSMSNVGGHGLDRDNDSNPEVMLPEVVDGWGQPILYRTQRAGNFPILRSAGADATFYTADDIVSSEL